MVRLKVQTDVNAAVISFHFNSTMVRLKEYEDTTPTPLAAFQFHYGTIKSCVTAICRKTCFNFNSTMVRLKDHRQGARQPYLADFNSTMVRLKDAYAGTALLEIPFQFHYGTIKRVSRRAASRGAMIISIPLWYD